MSAIEVFFNAVFNKRRYIAALYFLLVQTAYLFFTALPSVEDRWFLISYCNQIPLFLALAFVFRKTQIIKAIISVGLLIQTAWILDFVCHLLGFPALGITDYIFTAPFSVPNLVSTIDHTLTMPIALALTYRYRTKLVSLIYSFFYIIALYLITLLATPVDYNINCVFQTCILKAYAFPQYTALWPVFIVILAIAGYLIQKSLYYL